MKEYRVAILGATGLVGQEFIKVLEQRNFPMSSILLLASDRSAGKKLFVAHKEIEVKEGKRRSIERHVFPGYVLVNMILTEESWYVVRNTPGVTGFVGMGNEPTPLRSEEVTHILQRMEAEAPHVKVSFKQGERVRIIDGPFNDFRGTVSEIDVEHAKVTVMVNFFGRETPVVGHDEAPPWLQPRV